MDNNKLCNILSSTGGLILFLSMVGIFFGAKWWPGAIVGIIIALFGLFNYED